jgi:hypothetical protein
MPVQRPNWLFSGRNSGERANASLPFSAREHAARVSSPVRMAESDPIQIIRVRSKVKHQ